LRSFEIAVAKNANGLTPKQEAFCLAYVETKSPSEAYRQAYDASGMKPNVIAVKASELMDNPAIVARVAAIQATREVRMHERFELDIERVKSEYAKLAYANMLDYVAVQPDGTAYVDLSRLTREQAAAIAAIEVEEYVEGKGEDARAVKRVKFKLHDKRGALSDSARILGIFKDKTEHTGKDGAPLLPENAATPRELARAIMDIFRSAATENKHDP